MKVKCLKCESINYLSGDYDDAYGWRCWNCQHVWTFEIWPGIPMIIINGLERRDE